MNKHKLFLLCAKWIPVVTAIGILVTNTIAYYGCNDIVVDIFNFNIGTSVAGVILMYVCSYAFNFCIWHKLVITYNALIIAIVFIIRYCITECSYSYLLLSYYILAGIILLLILYIHSKNMKNFEHIIDHYKDHIRLDNETAWNIICRFKDIVENKNDKDNEMFWCIMKDIHEELRGKHFDEVYATYQVDNMYHTDNKGNKITSPMFTPIDVRKLYDKKFKSINSNITFWDVYVALNAQYHDNIELYKEWFGEDNIENIKDKIIESAIVNWFEDEDAGIEKVWNYFRAI